MFPEIRVGTPAKHPCREVAAVLFASGTELDRERVQSAIAEPHDFARKSRSIITLDIDSIKMHQNASKCIKMHQIYSNMTNASV